MKTRLLALTLTAAAVLSLLPTAAFAAGSKSNVSYLPDVTAAMSDPAYWSQDDQVLMTWEEIQEQNARNISVSGTNMRDLQEQAEIVNGYSINEGLLRSTQADVDYYLGWTYFGSDTLATQQDFDPAIANTQNRYATRVQSVLYGVAVHRTHLRVLPSPTPIWDDPKDPDFDYQYLVGVRVNEPLVITSVSADGAYYLAKSICCSGWVPAEDVAICKDRAQWLSAWNLAPEDTLVVYGDKLFTETSLTAPETSDLMLTMGTALELADIDDPNALIDNRAPYQNYAVWLPIRNEDGSYGKKMVLISEHAPVSQGYLPLTKANVMMVAMQALGNTYGWGGSLNSEDCSSYVRNIYKCFGLELARNGTWQAAMPIAKADMKDMCREDRLRVLDALPAGSLLYFSGHEMMYLGRDNGKYYVISSVSKIRDPWGSSSIQRIRSVIINTLDITRASGVSWLDSLTAANVPYWTMEDGQSNPLLQPSWYHDGAAYCLKNKIMTAYDNGLFYPEQAVTRAQLAQILFQLAGKPEAAESTFTDVTADSWFAPAADWAVSSNILPSKDSDHFGPNDVLTREQTITALWNFAKQSGYSTPAENTSILDSYADSSAISPACVPAMQWACEIGLVTGEIRGNHRFLNPADSLTRAQIATVLMQFKSLPVPEET